MTSVAQLSLFDVAQTVATSYQVGDRVKLRKKPLAASYLRKGDIVEVGAIHPLDGSLKFWNERSERWEFVYPDEIGSIVPPADNDDFVSTDKPQIDDTEYTVPPADNYDSVSTDKPQIVDTEYTVPPADNYDSVSTDKPQIDDTEYTVPSADNDDSVSTDKPQIVDTEYTVPPADNDDSVSTDKPQIDDTEYTVPPADNDDSVSTDKPQIDDTEYTVPPADNDDSVSKAISTYHPRGTARSGKYFRLSYRDGLRMKHIHIRGGNTDSPIAQAKVQEVRSLLATGIAPSEIAAMLKTQRSM